MKNFDLWNIKKKEIDNSESNFYKTRDIIDIGIIDGTEAFVIISQLRLIDTKRLHDRLAILNMEKFDEIRKAIRNLI